MSDMQGSGPAVGISRSFFRTVHGCGAVVADGAALLEVMLPFGSGGRSAIEEGLIERYGDDLLESELTVQAAAALERYFRGEAISLRFPVNLHKFSPFTRRVLELTAEIPPGETRTYAEIAAAAGTPRAARGVGGALGRNPLPLVIPCHRVVASDGRLTGFSAPGGVNSKRLLLAMEGISLDRCGRVCGR